METVIYNNPGDLRAFAAVATDAAIQAGEVVDPMWPFSEKQIRADIQAAALKLRAPNDPPVAWIIERDGRVAMIHYEKCAVKAAADGYIVTPYYSKVVR